MARAMKDSGVLWAGEIPTHWQVVRLKECFIENNRSQPNKTVLSLSYGRIIEKDFSAKKGVTPESFDSYQGVHPGDVVLRLTDLQNDQKSLRVGYAEMHGIITSAYLCVRGRGLHSKFSAYLLHDIGDIQKVFYGLGGGVRQSMKYADLAEILVPQLSRDEQRRIAAWLDIQTSRINRRLELLGTKRELLLELRQALIDEVISTGVAQPDIVETGQSALPFLPAHWSLSKFKRKVFFREGPGIMAIDFTDTGVPLLRIGNITPGVISMAGCNYLASEKVERQWRQFRLRLGDLVISASASTGIVSEAGNDAVGAIPYTGLITLRPKSGLSKEFLRFFVISKSFLTQIEDYLKGSTIHHFGPTHLRQMLIPIPPPSEQDEIAKMLEKRTSRIDAQLTLIDQLEALLKEQRKAIIHEAVTGKIDLSAYEPPQPQEALAA
jgi:type I restriction enzyme S subunit